MKGELISRNKIIEREKGELISRNKMIEREKEELINRNKIIENEKAELINLLNYFNNIQEENDYLKWRLIFFLKKQNLILLILESSDGF